MLALLALRCFALLTSLAVLPCSSGGAIMIGKHCLKTWSKTQALVAKSSGEAELYAVVKGAAEALGMVTLARDLGRKASRGRKKRNLRRMYMFVYLYIYIIYMYIITIYISNLGDQLRLLLSSSSGIIKGMRGACLALKMCHCFFIIINITRVSMAHDRWPLICKHGPTWEASSNVKPSKKDTIVSSSPNTTQHTKPMIGRADCSTMT